MLVFAQTLCNGIKGWRPAVAVIRSSTAPIVHQTFETESLCDRISSAASRWEAVCAKVSDWKPRLNSLLICREDYRTRFAQLYAAVDDIREEIFSFDSECAPPQNVNVRFNELMVCCCVINPLTAAIRGSGYKFFCNIVP